MIDCLICVTDLGNLRIAAQRWLTEHPDGDGACYIRAAIVNTGHGSAQPEREPAIVMPAGSSSTVPTDPQQQREIPTELATEDREDELFYQGALIELESRGAVVFSAVSRPAGAKWDAA